MRITARRIHHGICHILLALLSMLAGSLVTNMTAVAQEKTPELNRDQAVVMAILAEQVKAWNAGDLEAFMKHYWKSTELTFSAGGSTTRGWQATLDRYKAKYDSREKMGTLKFDELKYQQLSDNVCLVLGKWHLTLNAGDTEGNFSIVLKQMEDGWKIVHDHSSTLEKD